MGGWVGLLARLWHVVFPDPKKRKRRHLSIIYNAIETGKPVDRVAKLLRAAGHVITPADLNAVAWSFAYNDNASFMVTACIRYDWDILQHLLRLGGDLHYLYDSVGVARTADDGPYVMDAFTMCMTSASAADFAHRVVDAFPTAITAVDDALGSMRFGTCVLVVCMHWPVGAPGKVELLRKLAAIAATRWSIVDLKIDRLFDRMLDSPNRAVVPEAASALSAFLPSGWDGCGCLVIGDPWRVKWWKDYALLLAMHEIGGVRFTPASTVRFVELHVFELGVELGVDVYGHFLRALDARADLVAAMPPSGVFAALTHFRRPGCSLARRVLELRARIMRRAGWKIYRSYAAYKYRPSSDVMATAIATALSEEEVRVRNLAVEAMPTPTGPMP